MRIEADGVVYEVDNSAPSNRVMLTACGVLGWRNGATFPFRSYEPRGSALGHISSGTILAPMPGRVIAVEVSAGDAVSKGQKLLTLEAMKMEHTLVAPFDGTVAELNASPGAQVRVDAPLARIEPAKERD